MMRVLISERHRYIYHMNPKVGTNSILTVLYEIAGLTGEPLANPHRTSRDDALLKAHYLRALDVEAQDYPALTSQYSGFYTFSSVRNPFTRLKSAYNDKLKRYAELAHPQLIKKLARDHEGVLDKRGVQRALKEQISFAEFVHGVCQVYPQGDQHWQVQYDRLRPDLCRFDCLMKIENFKSEFAKILVNIGEGDYRIGSKRRNAAPDARAISDYFTPQLAELVREAYRRDFETFNYSLELPA